MYDHSLKSITIVYHSIILIVLHTILSMQNSFRKNLLFYNKIINSFKINFFFFIINAEFCLIIGIYLLLF